jgi:hypothetical protein
MMPPQLQDMGAAGALSSMTPDAVIKSIQEGKMESIEQLISNHTAVVQTKGLSSGSYYAINGKLHRFQGRPQVRYHFGAS